MSQTLTLEAPGAPSAPENPSLPPVALPGAPRASQLWRRGLVVVWVAYGLIMLDRLTTLLANYWFFQSVGQLQVFWTNFWTQAALWVGIGALFAAATIVPALVHPLARGSRKLMVQVGLLLGVLSGNHYIGTYRTWLLFFNATQFHQTDPVYHHDIGFYVFQLPALKLAISVLTTATLVAVVSSIACAWMTRIQPRPATSQGRFAFLIGTVASRPTRVALSVLAVLGAIDVWLTRYDLLIKNNAAKSVTAGAAYLDVRGFFDTKNFITVEALAALVSAVFVYLRLSRLRRAAVGEAPRRVRATVLIPAVAPGLILIAVFAIVLSIRNMTQVKPNEPVVQYPYIQRHIDGTLAGWGLTGVQSIQWTPPVAGDPAPTAADILNSPTLSNDNAPLWPGFTSYLEQLVDPQHAERVLLTGGDHQVYGTSIDVFNQQQQLRNYYDIVGVDTVRYPIGGQPHLMVSAARELPSNPTFYDRTMPGPADATPWLTRWGQKYLLFTHGYGLVMSPLGASTSQGFPAYASQNIPPQVTDPVLATKQPAIYYGEAAKAPVFVDVPKVPSLDYPTAEGRAQVELPASVPGGVRMDSILKRAVFGWKTRNFFSVLFSNIITPHSRVLYYRSPLERAERIAPFLYIDTNVYAVSAEGRVVWMLNGMTTTRRYPYSLPEYLGDKSDERTQDTRNQRFVNYARDAVKITVDGYTGTTHFYSISNDPIMRAWEKVYPGLFQSKAAMPTTVRQQVQYPIHLFHTQFDDIYNFYHMKDAPTFFNFEDAWDDGNEVLGPILSHGLTVTFSIEPFYWIGQAGQTLPPSSVQQQFVMAGVFTNEQALNLRAIPFVYMTGSDYGKLSVLTVPKGDYVTGPEQAEAAIDQDPYIAQQVGFWNRQGDDIIRGHMSTLVVDNELMYIEGFYIRSQQDPIPQLKRVVVVLRGKPAMGRNVAEAVQLALQPGENGIPTGPESFNLED